MKYFRQYIRQILLTEGMKTPSDLPEDAYVWIMDGGNRFSVRIDAPSWRRSKAEITLRKSLHGCSGAWEVVSATAATGWGPLAYDIAMEYVGHEGIMCDRSSVSDDAARVWRFYLNNRSDVTPKQLDQLARKKLTPNDESDDCSQYTFLQHTMMPPEEYGWDYYKKHWATKAYVKMGGTPIIDQLNDMNILEYK